MKNLIIFLLVISIVLVPTFGETSSDTHSDEENAVVQPMFTNIYTFHAGMGISSSGRAGISASLDGHSGSSSKINANLQQYDGNEWVTIKTFTNDSTSSSCVLGSSYYVMKGYSYRTVFYAYVYGGQIILDKTILTSKTVVY